MCPVRKTFFKTIRFIFTESDGLRRKSWSQCFFRGPIPGSSTLKFSASPTPTPRAVVPLRDIGVLLPVGVGDPENPLTLWHPSALVWEGKSRKCKSPSQVDPGGQKGHLETNFGAFEPSPPTWASGWEMPPGGRLSGAVSVRAPCSLERGWVDPSETGQRDRLQSEGTPISCSSSSRRWEEAGEPGSCSFESFGGFFVFFLFFVFFFESFSSPRGSHEQSEPFYSLACVSRREFCVTNTDKDSRREGLFPKQIKHWLHTSLTHESAPQEK